MLKLKYKRLYKMTTQNPDLKKLFVYVNFGVTGGDLTAAINALVEKSNGVYKDRIFFLQNTDML